MQSTRKIKHSHRFEMALKHKMSNRDKDKSHATEKQRQHGEIDCRYNGRANDGANSHARIGGHILNAVRRASVGDGEALQRHV
jgi:hypothetical protein